MSLRNSKLIRLGTIGLMETARRTHARRLLPALLQSQFASGEELESRQFESLRRHLTYCVKNVPYYRDLFTRVGLAPANVFSHRDLEALPVMTKAMIRDAGAALHSNEFTRLQARQKSTSGSTGIPLNYYIDAMSHSYLWAHIWRAWAVAGYRPGDAYATLSGGALLPEKVDLKQRIYLYLSGAIHLPSYHLTDAIMERYASVIEGRGIRFMYGYPSSLEMFARFLTERGRPRPSFASVFTTSEVLTPTARAAITDGLDSPVYDTYGCNDAGLYAFECDKHYGWHQNMESCFVEIVDHCGRSLPDGEVGTVLTTHFTNRAHPFIRYDTGDMGAIDRRPCACGRGLLRIVDLRGRERDIVITPTGRKIHGAFFNHFEPFYNADWLVRYQVYQPDRTRIEVRVKTRRQPDASEIAHIVRTLQSGLDGIAVDVREVQDFAYTSAGKFRVVISEAN